MFQCSQFIVPGTHLTVVNSYTFPMQAYHIIKTKLKLYFVSYNKSSQHETKPNRHKAPCLCKLVSSQPPPRDYFTDNSDQIYTRYQVSAFKTQNSTRKLSLSNTWYIICCVCSFLALAPTHMPPHRRGD